MLKKLITTFLLFAANIFVAFADEAAVDYLVIELGQPAESDENEENGIKHEFLLTNDLVIINHHDGTLEIKKQNISESYDVSGIKSIGFLIKDDTALSVDDILSTSVVNGWKIFSLDGILIDSGDEGEPSLSKLDCGKIYIIVYKDKKYKYMPVKL